jgi:threonylcarbamoyladenosine tRNA methylthiotransferase MtaB
MMREMLAAEYRVVEDEADLYLINACTVTSLAERKARQLIHRLRREFPVARIVVIGCVGDAVAAGLSKLDNVDLVAGNSWKVRVNEIVERALSGEKGLLPSTGSESLDKERITRQSGRIRAFLKIQDGCDFACSFCRTTQVRGSSRSKPVQAIISEATNLVKNGYPEIILTGINLAQYASTGGNLATLSKKLLQIEGLHRLRLASINPYGIDEDLVNVFAGSKRACPHFHISLQSGDDDILRAMQRGYTRDFLLSRVDLVRRIIPEATFGSDIIVGFPGEGDDAFKNTLDIIGKVGFVNLHLFRYSARAGTIAACARDQIPEKVKHERAQEAQQVYRATQQSLLSSYVGKSAEVLLESEAKKGKWRGYTREYIDAYVNTALSHNAGDEVVVRISGVGEGYVLGDEKWVKA